MTKKRKAARGSSARKSKSPAKRSARAAMSIATSAPRTVEERVAAMEGQPLAVCENDENLQAMLNVLRNVDEPVTVRLAALQALQAGR